jgi:hypothetical protein
MIHNHPKGRVYPLIVTASKEKLNIEPDRIGICDIRHRTLNVQAFEQG